MSDYLIHYGIKGMKWGVRKARPTSGHSRLHRAYNAQMRDAADLRKHGYNEEAKAVEKVAQNTKRKIEKKEAKRSAGGMSTGKKVAIAAGVGVAVAGTVLAVYGKKKYGSLNPKKMKAAKEIADRISGKNSERALKSIQKDYTYSRVFEGLKYKNKSNSQITSQQIYNNAETAKRFKNRYNMTGSDLDEKMMDTYANMWGPTKTVRFTTPRRSRKRSINAYY